MRLFLSIALPDKIREQIVASRERIKVSCFTRVQLQRMRWINEKEYHVTQYFIGEVQPERLNELKEVVQHVIASTKPFALESAHFEFKPVNNPRLLWLRFKLSDSFAELQQRLHNALVEGDLSSNKIADDPIPHVTLIRLKQVKPLNTLLPGFELQKIIVEQIDLMQSFMNPGGAEYKVLEQFAMDK